MIYIVLLLLSFTLTYFIKEYAIKKALVAEVNERSSHTDPTPHGGGIALSVTWFIGLTCLFYTEQIEVFIRLIQNNENLKDACSKSGIKVSAGSFTTNN